MRSGLVWGAGLALAWGVACGSRGGERAPNTVVLVPPAASSGDVAPGGGPPASGLASDLRPSFACGEVRCRVGKESCCAQGERSACSPNAAPGPLDSMQLLGAQIEACSQFPQPIEVDEIARCRSSAHCASGELCCDEFLFSGASALICKVAEKTRLSCSYGEVCTPDLSCSGPSDVCSKGKCRKHAEVQCGTTRCNLTTHTCQVAEPPTGRLACVADTQVAQWRAQGRPILDIACVTHADCHVGELCRTAQFRSFCQRADAGMSAVVCDQPSDCPKSLCDLAPPGHRQLACARGPGTWHATCECR
jgi:hypothetical protein